MTQKTINSFQYLAAKQQDLCPARVSCSSQRMYSSHFIALHSSLKFCLMSVSVNIRHVSPGPIQAASSQADLGDV